MLGDLGDHGQGSVQGALGGLRRLRDRWRCSSAASSASVRMPSASRRARMRTMGIAQGVGLALGLGAIELVVVGEGVGVGADAVAVDKGRPEAGAAVGHGGLKGEEAGLGVGAVHFGKVEVGEVGHQAGDVAAGRTDFDRGADGVAVVFHAEDDRAACDWRRCSGPPRTRPARWSPRRGRRRRLRRRGISRRGRRGNRPRARCGGFGMAAEVAAGLGAADGVEELRGGGGGEADDVERAAAPVGGHLAAAAGWIGGRADGLQQHLVGRARRAPGRARGRDSRGRTSRSRGAWPGPRPPAAPRGPRRRSGRRSSAGA